MALDWTNKLKEQKTEVKAGDPITLEVQTNAADPTKVTFTWTKTTDANPAPVTLANQAESRVFTISQTTADDSGRYQVTASEPGSQTPAITTWEELSIADEDEKPPSGPPGEWDADFATSSRTVAGIGALALTALSLAVFFAWNTSGLTLSEGVALGLLASSAVLIVFGVWLSAIEVRGQQRLRAAVGDSRSAWSELAGKAPEVLKEFGGLTPAKAVLATAVVPLICATVVAFQSLSPSSSEPSDSPSESPSPAASASAQ